MKRQTAVDMLRMMMKIRLTEETIAERYSEWKMRCPTHLCTGQEAVGAAAGMALRKDDFAVSTHRAHGHYLGKGGDLNRMIAEIYGKTTGCSRGRGGSMHLIDRTVGFMGSTAIVGGTIPIGVGLGLSIQLKGTDQLSCIFLGDGAVEEGVFYEAVNFAVLKRLPVLFICENNLYSVYSAMRVRQPAGRRIHRMVAAMGMEAGCGDGNDVVRTYETIRRSVDGIRAGRGPRFLEFETYRWREHCGPNYDNDIGYRSREEFLEWKRRDPIKAFESLLLEENRIDSACLHRLKESIAAEVEAAFAFAEASTFPDQSEAFTNLYR